APANCVRGALSCGAEWALRPNHGRYSRRRSPPASYGRLRRHRLSYLQIPFCGAPYRDGAPHFLVSSPTLISQRRHYLGCLWRRLLSPSQFLAPSRAPCSSTFSRFVLGPPGLEPRTLSKGDSIPLGFVLFRLALR